MSGYQICSRCVMDTTDTEITFDAKGVCSHCQTFDRTAPLVFKTGPEGKLELDKMVRKIKKESSDKEYDCIIGLSGGVDSSYLAYWAAQQGLRCLAVHVDAGWNSELAVSNIENIVKKLKIDLHTYVVDWEEMRDLQLAFFRSGVANQDTPQDHAFFAALYGFATQNKIKYVLSGSNYATESILPALWGYDAMDETQLKAIHKQFGTRPLRAFPTVSFYQYYIQYPRILGMEVLTPLNFMPYRKDEAMGVLEKELGWRYYGGKHYESRFTKFFQAYWLPTKFGFDKRKAHLSSLVVSGEITREQALEELEKPLYDPVALQEDKEMVCKKLGVSVSEFDALMAEPNRSYSDYPNHQKKLQFFRSSLLNMRRVLGLGRRAGGIVKRVGRRLVPIGR